MSKRLVMVTIAALIALPAYAAESGPAPETLNLEQHDLATVALAGVLPAGPILSDTQGATGGGNILVGAIYGGLAGAVIGTAVALIEGGNYGRDIGIGAGAGILVGAALGATNAFGDRSGPYPASDGLGSTDRDPVIQAHTLAYAGSF